VRPALLIGTTPPVRQVSTRRTASASTTSSPMPLSLPVPAASTVEVIRGDKRAHEIVRGQE